MLLKDKLTLLIREMNRQYRITWPEDIGDWKCTDGILFSPFSILMIIERHSSYFLKIDLLIKGASKFDCDNLSSKYVNSIRDWFERKDLQTEWTKEYKRWNR